MFNTFFTTVLATLSTVLLALAEMLAGIGIFPHIPTEYTLTAPYHVVHELPADTDTEERAPDTATEQDDFTNIPSLFDDIVSVLEGVLDTTPTPTPITQSSETSETRVENPNTTTLPIPSPEELNASARAALVNILCITKNGGVANTISGSGMIIDPRGIIVTNAHIGQYLLLERYKNGSLIDCAIRTGAPATLAYDATPLYVSSAWIEENAHTIAEENPTGTGEHDIAFLLITTSRAEQPLPQSFPFINYAKSTDYEAGMDVTVAGYPAEYIGGATVQNDLWPVVTDSSLLETFTFQSGAPDLFLIQGSIASQHGSSGGGIIDSATGKLIGVVVTSTDGETTDNRRLGAITYGHIDDTVIADTGRGIAALLADPPTQTAYFAETEWQRLLDMLLEELR